MEIGPLLWFNCRTGGRLDLCFAYCRLWIRWRRAGLATVNREALWRVEMLETAERQPDGHLAVIALGKDGRENGITLEGVDAFRKRIPPPSSSCHRPIATAGLCIYGGLGERRRRLAGQFRCRDFEFRNIFGVTRPHRFFVLLGHFCLILPSWELAVYHSSPLLFAHTQSNINPGQQWVQSPMDTPMATPKPHTPSRKPTPT